MKKKRLVSLIATLAIFTSRLGMLPANISPVGSFGFFGQNIWLFALTTIGFDFFKGGFYPGVLFTYLGFLSYFLLGKVAKTNKQKIILLPTASLLFFLLSNFGVWLYWYPNTLSGLIKCYLLALPFYQKTLIGDLIFGYSYLVINKFLASATTRALHGSVLK